MAKHRGRVSQKAKFRKCAKSGKGKSRVAFRAHMKKCLRR